MKTTTMVYLGCGAAVLAGAAAWWWSGRSAIPGVPAPALPSSGALEVTVTPVALTSKPDVPPAQSALQANGVAVVNTGFVPPDRMTTERLEQLQSEAAPTNSLPPALGVGAIAKVLQTTTVPKALPAATAPTTQTIKVAGVSIPIFRAATAM